MHLSSEHGVAGIKDLLEHLWRIGLIDPVNPARQKQSLRRK